MLWAVMVAIKAEHWIGVRRRAMGRENAVRCRCDAREHDAGRDDDWGDHKSPDALRRRS